MLGRSLRVAFWLSYDFLGTAMLCNTLVMTGALVLLGAALSILAAADAIPEMALAAFMLLCASAWAGAGAAGICQLWKAGLETRMASFRDFGDGLRAHGPKGAMAGVGLFIVEGAVLGAAVLYGGGFFTAPPLAGALLAGICLGTALVLAMVGIWLWPVLVHTSGAWQTRLKLAMLLAAKRPGLSMGILCWYVAGAAIAVLLTPFVILWSLAPTMALSMAAYEWLDRQYAAGEGPFPDPNDPLVLEYMDRSFRNFWFPWKE